MKRKALYKRYSIYKFYQILFLLKRSTSSGRVWTIVANMTRYKNTFNKSLEQQTLGNFTRFGGKSGHTLPKSCLKQSINSKFFSYIY